MSTYVATLLGAFVGVALVVFNTSNPARIPMSRIVIRASFGVGLLLITSATLATLFWLYLLNPLSIGWGLSHSVTVAIALATGMLIPYLGFFKDWAFSYKISKHLKPALRIFQSFDDVTRLYLGRIIAREERKINLEFFSGDQEEVARREVALMKLFEVHIVEIARWRRKQLSLTDPDSILAVFKFRDRDLRFKLLLRFLGYRKCRALLSAVARHPDAVYPEWQPENRERRRRAAGPDRDFGRRISDSPYAQAYVLGSDEMITSSPPSHEPIDDAMS